MKSKYSQVVKVRKQELDKAETNLLHARQRQMANEEALRAANAELQGIAMPKSGSSVLLKQTLEFKQIAKNMQNAALEKVELSKKECAHYQNLYKNANLAYEKMKYLETDEIKQKQEALKKAEQKMLDEVAVSKYFREKKQNESV